MKSSKILYYFIRSQAQLQQQLSPNEYAQMQERENAIVQLEVGQSQTVQAESDPLQAQQTQELEQLERDIQDMAETFTEVHKLVHDQGEQIGKPCTGLLEYFFDYDGYSLF